LEFNFFNEPFHEQNNNQINQEGARFTTSASQRTTQTFDVPHFFAYKGNHNEHISPVVQLLESLKTKLRNSKKITADRLLDLTGESKKAEKAAEIVSLKVAHCWHLDCDVL
jgi:hypothetical protein